MRWWFPLRKAPRPVGIVKQRDSVGKSTRTGIWHETYVVQAGEYEALYRNMPPHGLGKSGRLVPATKASRARERLKAAQG